MMKSNIMLGTQKKSWSGQYGPTFLHRQILEIADYDEKESTSQDDEEVKDNQWDMDGQSSACSIVKSNRIISIIATIIVAMGIIGVSFLAPPFGVEISTVETTTAPSWFDGNPDPTVSSIYTANGEFDSTHLAFCAYVALMGLALIIRSHAAPNFVGAMKSHFIFALFVYDKLRREVSGEGGWRCDADSMDSASSFAQYYWLIGGGIFFLVALSDINTGKYSMRDKNYTKKRGCTGIAIVNVFSGFVLVPCSFIFFTCGYTFDPAVMIILFGGIFGGVFGGIAANSITQTKVHKTTVIFMLCNVLYFGSLIFWLTGSEVGRILFFVSQLFYSAPVAIRARVFSRMMDVDDFINYLNGQDQNAGNPQITFNAYSYHTYRSGKHTRTAVTNRSDLNMNYDECKDISKQLKADSFKQGTITRVKVDSKLCADTKTKLYYNWCYDVQLAQVATDRSTRQSYAINQGGLDLSATKETLVLKGSRPLLFSPAAAYLMSFLGLGVLYFEWVNRILSRKTHKIIKFLKTSEFADQFPDDYQIINLDDIGQLMFEAQNVNIGQQQQNVNNANNGDYEIQLRDGEGEGEGVYNTR